MGLYRDDGLAARKLTGPQADQARKDIEQIFKGCGLRVTENINLVKTDFLDVMFNLQSSNFWLYCKPNNEPLYINAKSNHPPTVIKHLPAAINCRVALLSCNEEEFLKAKAAYEEALKKSGYSDGGMTYVEQRNGPWRPHQRNITWFNPPYNQNVTTDMAKQFLKLVDKQFPRHHRYHKLFNRNNVKCSYSCMNNMAAIISSHNAKMMAPAPNRTVRTCNCRQPQSCPLRCSCLNECVVYKATVSAISKPVRYYYGLTEGLFKNCFNAHTCSFWTASCRKETALSKYIWELRDQDIDHMVKWDIVQCAAPYKCGTRRCDMCLSEKMVIATADPTTLLNSRTEIVSTCRHQAKFRLDKVLPVPS
jgi:hypothetical protein